MKNLDPKSKWLFFGWYILPALLILFFVGLMFGVPFIFLALRSPFFSLLVSLFSLFFLSALVYIFAHLSYENWHYELTNDSLRVERGVIWKHYVSIPYERIQNVNIVRGPLARILGLSDLQIQTAGYSHPSSAGVFGASEGRIPGLDPQTAESLREELVQKAKESHGGV